MVTAGEEPQTSETQHRLASTDVLQMGSVWSTGRPPSHGMTAAPCEGWRVPHRAVLWRKDVALQIPWEICFHAYAAMTKRRDRVLTPIMAAGKTYPAKGIGRNLHSCILLSPCSHANLNTRFFTLPWTHCRCPFSWGEHFSWCTQQSCRDVLRIWLPPAPHRLSLDCHNLTLL